MQDVWGRRRRHDSETSDVADMKMVSGSPDGCDGVTDV
jgi:hypothetical protein